MSAKGSRPIHFLYSGTYSCIYHPSPLCHRKLAEIEPYKKPMIGKIVRPVDSPQEWQLAQSLYKIDPNQFYFVYPYELCEIQAVQDSRKCPFMKKDQSLHMFKIPYGTHNLATYVSNRKQMISLKTFIPKVIHLMEGLSLFHKAGWIHQDIKTQNILEKNHEFRWIDFGISLKKNQIFDLEINGPFLNADYVIHPPEYRYFSRYYFISKGVESMETFVNNEWYLLHYILKEDKQRNIDLYQSYYTYDTFKQACQRLFDTLKHTSKTSLQKLFTHHVTKVDIYSFGMVLLHISPYLQLENTPASILFKQLIQSMIHPNIFERYNTQQCLKLLKQILKVL